ncbi:MAG: hypothetical protein KF703_01355 [Actinobacteria bacterium]|nr:hypothetical protein [Actinomycetota bacterium]
MAITEESRQDLFQLFETTYGREGALLIMDFLPPVGWADVATKHDLEMQTELLTRDMKSVRQEAASGIGSLRQELERTAEVLGRDIEGAKHELRAEIAQLEVRLLTAFGSFRDEVHAERRAMSRAVILALVVALISMVVSTVGLG